ncbi:4-hydroxy-3-methylbut-2-en-1-yl diphosphate synthase (flavodoxin) 1 [Kitasatospora phosalacinea]|uniref:4-hydroxy-3-methylbut-2-en-1-yl diphosphate synthase (flavodoxin) n=1 Tax=Kitasatospora phosalacinea TaxID=2065 RepID=A0A9W6V2G6_9ACTN|nr:flavodoxin-dependent (E)-4-hydroxy-3-methylbut-2-enyl-diphosphate synthase [Kitasatospora phosalacinea]GLW72646.1 4-hydroxy-3-methylbut-2-en-1-yl diphosphate synthase (flavodoxin) 1 [Kitasatospora phosalacinea]
MTAVDLTLLTRRAEPPGAPGAAAGPAVPQRRPTRRIQVGSVPVGGGAPISVQTMTTTVTADVDATLQQIAEVTAAGCDLVRVAVPSQDDVQALPAIVAKSPIPVIADIHFQPRYVFAAIDAGCAAVRVNPGNIRQFDDKVKEIAAAATAAKVPIRIGVNAGSLDPRLLAKYGKATPEALVESALWECSLFEEHGFTDLKIAVKHHDPQTMIAAYRQLSAARDYPLHLGVTEAGPAFQGSIKSAVAMGILLNEGIGDTIRVSLSAPPAEQVKAGCHVLAALGLRPRKLEIVSCPGCGRLQVDIHSLAARVEAAFEGFPHPLRVAVMGCVVNGPGESREADLGVSSGNGKGQIFVRGEVVKTVPESRIVETLLEEALRLAEAESGQDQEENA